MNQIKVFPREAYQDQGYEEGDGVGYKHYDGTPQEWWRATTLIKHILNTKRSRPIRIQFTDEQFDQVIKIQICRLKEIFEHQYVQDKNSFVIETTGENMGMMQLIGVATLILIKKIANKENYQNYLVIIDELYGDKIERTSKAYFLGWFIQNNNTITKYIDGIKQMHNII
jgi:hypothetical protein